MTRLAIVVECPEETEESNPVTVALSLIDQGEVISAGWTNRSTVGASPSLVSQPWPTGLRVGNPQPVQDDQRRDRVTYLRQIGWLDQKGRVWTDVPSSITFDGGSLTPLLVEVGS